MVKCRKMRAFCRAFCTKILKEVSNLSYKNIQYGRTRVRRNYARVQTNVELPNLIEVQTESFKWLLETGLKELFTELSPTIGLSFCAINVKTNIEETRTKVMARATINFVLLLDFRLQY